MQVKTQTAGTKVTTFTRTQRHGTHLQPLGGPPHPFHRAHNTLIHQKTLNTTQIQQTPPHLTDAIFVVSLAEKTRVVNGRARRLRHLGFQTRIKTPICKTTAVKFPVIYIMNRMLFPNYGENSCIVYGKSESIGQIEMHQSCTRSESSCFEPASGSPAQELKYSF